MHLLSARTKICLSLSVVTMFSCLADKYTFAQTSDSELLAIMQSVVDTENEVRQTGDVEAALSKKALDDSENTVIREELQEIKRQKDF